MSHVNCNDPSTSADREKRRSIEASICLALCIAMGGAIIWGCVVGWAFSGAAVAPGFKQLQVTADGTLLLSEYDLIRRQWQYFTLDNQPAPGAARSTFLQGAAIAPKLPATDSQARSGPTILSFTDGLPSPASWYFVRFADPIGSGFFVGYDFISRRRIGYIGQNGFQVNEPTADKAFQGGNPTSYSRYPWGEGAIMTSLGDAQPRPGKISGWVCHLVSSDHLFRVDFRKRTAKSIYQSPQMVDVAKLQRRRKELPAEPKGEEEFFEDYLAVRDGNGVTILDSNGQVETTYHLPARLEKTDFQLYLTSGGKAIATDSNLNRRGEFTSWSVIEFSPDGTVIHQNLDVGAVQPTGFTPAKAAGISFAVPEPIVPLLVTFLLSPLFRNRGSEPIGYFASVSEAMTDYWPMLLLTTIFGIVSVGLYWRHAVRYGYQPRVAWMVFIFLSGFPGFVGYWLHRRWPVQLACPSCRMDVPRDRELCDSCGAEFPAPAPNGLEVFG